MPDTFVNRTISTGKCRDDRAVGESRPAWECLARVLKDDALAILDADVDGGEMTLLNVEDALMDYACAAENATHVIVHWQRTTGVLTVSTPYRPDADLVLYRHPSPLT